jgi:hypothetical protein
MEYLLIAGTVFAIIGIIAAIIGRKQVKALEQKHGAAHK